MYTFTQCSSNGIDVNLLMSIDLEIGLVFEEPIKGYNKE